MPKPQALKTTALVMLALAVVALIAVTHVENGQYIIKMEGDIIKVIEPKSGKEVGQVTVRFVDSVRVEKVDRIPEATPPVGAERYTIKVMGDQVLLINEATNETFVVRIVRTVPPAVEVTKGPEPTITRATIPISGNLPPYTGHRYGPYSGILAMQFDVTWRPASLVCVDYVDVNSGTSPAHCTYGTGISAQFPIDPSQTVYAVVLNLGPNTITYSGTLTLYYQ